MSLPLKIDDRLTRLAFDEAYQTYILGSSFLENPEYYRHDKERYWKTLKHICQLGLHTSPAIVEFGGGQMAILLKAIYGCNCTVADISEDFALALRSLDIPLMVIDLTRDLPAVNRSDKADLLLLLEVIEHIPQPPARVFRRLSQMMNPNAKLFLTTPNLFRLRNIVRMVLGRDPFDRFMDPIAGVGLGHQMEYSCDHMRWQLEHAGFSIDYLEHDQLGQVGHSIPARFLRRLLSPLLLRQKWREEIVACATLL